MIDIKQKDIDRLLSKVKIDNSADRIKIYRQRKGTGGSCVGGTGSATGPAGCDCCTGSGLSTVAGCECFTGSGTCDDGTGGDFIFSSAVQIRENMSLTS